MTGKAVHQVAAKVIDQSKFKGKFTHGLGHSLGLEVHDGPGLSLRNSATLAQNMVMTVEPGIYLPGRRGRQDRGRRGGHEGLVPGPDQGHEGAHGDLISTVMKSSVLEPT